MALLAGAVVGAAGGNTTATFSPPTLLNTSEFPAAAFMAFSRTGSGTTSPPLIGSTSSGGLISHDGGVSFRAMPSLAKGGGLHPFVTMPSGSPLCKGAAACLHDTGTAGHGGNFGNGTSSHANSSTIFRVSAAGQIEVVAGPPASFTGLPTPLVCTNPDSNPTHSGDCMYGAGWAAWAQAAQLGDGTFVTTTAMVWLCGHFGVTPEQAGIYAWRSSEPGPLPAAC